MLQTIDRKLELAVDSDGIDDCCSVSSSGCLVLGNRAKALFHYRSTLRRLRPPPSGLAVLVANHQCDR